MYWLIFLLVVTGFLYYHYKRTKITNKSSTEVPEYEHAIIIGGSIGGMVTAASIAKYFRRITIIESDDVLNDTLMASAAEKILDYRCQLESPTSIGRSGVPQIYQLHLIEGAGHTIMKKLFPRLEDILCGEHDIKLHSLKDEFRLCVNGILLNSNFVSDLQWLGADRFTLETILRRELCRQFPGRIEWKSNTRVTQLIIDRANNCVQGVKYRPRGSDRSSIIDLYGDLIIDCSGRNSSSTKWLKEGLDIHVPNIQMHFGLGYVTFVAERFKTCYPEIDARSVIGCTPDAPYRNTGFYATPIRKIKPTDENSLGTLSTICVQCLNDEYPPNDSYENLLAWAKENLDDEYYQIMKELKVCSPLLPFRRAIDDRNLVESLGKQWPKQFIMLGDAMCTFNPQFGQGMTHACRQAQELEKIFSENKHGLDEIPYVYNRRAAAITEECWMMSTANDWKTPSLKIVTTDKYGHTTVQERDKNSPKSNKIELRAPLMIRILQWYTYWFVRCASKSGALATDFVSIMNQEKNPLVLFKPSTLFSVLFLALTTYLRLSK